MFQHRKLIIATKHRKELVMAPILEKALGVKCFVDENFDSDVLGTFTGEINRELDPIATAREKCLRAMNANHCDLGVASEGSFGPHPSLFFMGADDEFLIFIDLANHLEIVVRELSTETNFNGKPIENKKELLLFAEQVGFPSHGLILRNANNDNAAIFKGITDVNALMETYDLILSKYKTVYAETDMRALFNPSRMKVIESATKKLVVKINSQCPQCKTPSFDVKKSKKGLKCSLCGSPTDTTLSHIYVCQHCAFEKEEWYSNQKTTEDPTYCNYCNP